MTPTLSRTTAAVLALLFGHAATAADPVRHAFLATGGETFIADESGKVIWSYPHPSRDGWVLADGRILLALSKSKAYPGGAAVEVDRDGRVLFEFRGTQSEVNTVQPLAGGRVLLTEAGAKPRVLEVDRAGAARGRGAAACPDEGPPPANPHDPQAGERQLPGAATARPGGPRVRPGGAVVWEAKTPHMPFTAIRLPDGNTLIGCTLGNLVIEVDGKGNEVWRVTNDDLPGRPIDDACGVQRLANGNTVITSHHATAGRVKLLEVTRDKRIVWTHTDDRKAGIHHVQILDAGGRTDANPLR